MKSLSLAFSSATVQNLNDIRDFLEQAVQALGGDEDTAGDLVLAVNEAVTNSLLHGYGGHPGSISISAEAEGDDLLVRLTDGAPLFDPRSVPVPDIKCPLEDRPPGGMGVHMMRRLTDDLIYTVNKDGGNELTFIKRGAVGIPQP